MTGRDREQQQKLKRIRVGGEKERYFWWCRWHDSVVSKTCLNTGRQTDRDEEEAYGWRIRWIGQIDVGEVVNGRQKRWVSEAVSQTFRGLVVTGNHLPRLTAVTVAREISIQRYSGCAWRRGIVLRSGFEIGNQFEILDSVDTQHFYLIAIGKEGPPPEISLQL